MSTTLESEIEQSGDHRRVFRDARVDGLTTPADVLARLDRFRVRKRKVIFASVVLATIATAAACLFFVAVVDYCWPMPMLARRLLLAISLLSVGSVVVGRLLVIAVRGCSRTGIAKELESMHRPLGQSLRTLIRAGSTCAESNREGQRALMSNLLATKTDTACDAWGMEDRQSRTPLTITASACLSVGLIVVVWFAASWDTRLSIRRSLFADAAYTTVNITPGDTTIVKGMSADLSIELIGRFDDTVQLWTRPSDNETAQWQASRLETAATEVGLATDDRPHRRWTATIREVRESLDYRFSYDGSMTPTHRITSQEPIVIVTRQCQVISPEYTGLPTRTFTDPDVTVVEGSRLTFEIKTSSPLSAAKLQRSDTSGSAIDIATTIDGCIVRFELDANANIAWMLDGVNEAGVPLTDASGDIRVKPDVAPEIRWVSPNVETRVSSLAELTMQVDVQDDYGIVEAGIVFDIGDASGNVLANFAWPGGKGLSRAPTKRMLREVLPLEHFDVTQRDFLTYHAYAIDNHPDTPRRIESPVRYIDIRPLRQNLREARLMPAEANELNRRRLQLSEAINRQRRLIARTTEMLAWPTTKMQSGWRAVERHTQSQSDLADATREIAERQVAEGNDDVDSLANAEASMIAAVDSMEAGEMAIAQTQQDDAHRFLVEARDEIDITLVNANLPPLRRDVLNSLRRRLREQEDDNRSQQRELADQLRQLAQRQRALAEQLVDEVVPAQPLASEQQDQIRRAEVIGEVIDNQSWPTESVPRRMRLVVDQMSETLAMLDRVTPDDKQRESEQYSFLRTAVDLDELAFQIETLAAEEPTTLLQTMAQSLFQLSEAERDLGDEPNPESEDFVRRRSETMLDLIAELEGPADEQVEVVVDSLQKVLDELPVVDRLREAMEVRGKPPAEDSKPNRQRRGQVFQQAAEDLARAYRDLSSPRLEQLQRLKREAEQLAAAAEVEDGVSGDTEVLTAMAKNLIAGLEKQGMDSEADLISDKLASTSVGPRTTGTRRSGMRKAAELVKQELQARIAEILLREFEGSGDAAVPPGYQDVVDDYFRQLTNP